MSVVRSALTCLVFGVLAMTTGGADAADPFAELASPRPATRAADRGDRIQVPTRPTPEASEAARRFPSDETPVVGAPYTPPALEVVRTSPEGSEVRTDTVRVEFNQPMVGLDKLDSPDMALPPFSVEPRIQGRYLWLGTSEAAFHVEGGLPPDTEFEVLVPGGLGAPSGRRMDQRVRWSFRTAAIPSPAVTLTPRDPGATDVGGSEPPQLLIFPRVGTISAPIPILEAAHADTFPGFPDVEASLEQTAVPPAGPLALSIVVHPATGAPRTAGLSITVLSDASGAVVYQRGALLTDSSGRLSLSIASPAEEGLYRIYITAAQDDLGVAVTQLMAWVREPLTVRADLPARTRAGDRFSAGAIVRNRTHDARDILVRIRAAGAEIHSDPVPVTLAPGEERRIRVDAATLVPGDAVFQVAAAMLGADPALAVQTVTVPVHLCEPLTHAATYGVVDNALRIPLSLPKGASAHAGGLEVSITPDPRIILTDALLGLLESDDGTDGADLTASRILALVALGDGSHRAPFTALPPALRAVTSVPELTKSLLALQRTDGGFSPEVGMRQSDLSTSAWCSAALVRAREGGAKIPATALDRLITYLTAQLDGRAMSHGQRAVALRALAMLGVDASAALDSLYLAASGRSKADGRPVPIYAKAWLMEALHALDPSDVRIEELHRGLRGVAVERGDGITFPEDPASFEPASLHTPDRTDAVVLHALLTTRPEDTLIPRIASVLIQSMTDGRWATPRADVWALQALTRYYEGLTKERVSYEARAWLGDRMFLGRRFRRGHDLGRSRIPMGELLEDAVPLLRIGKRGDGRLFYRVALATARDWAAAPSEDHGLLVEREWSLVDVGRAADRAGAFRIRIAERDRVRLRVRVISDALRRRTRVDIPIPAGFHLITGPVSGPAPSTSWDAVEYLGHTVRLFQDVLEPGVYEYSITLRADTPGTWVLPPVRARALHNPGVSGKSRSEEIVILPSPTLSD
jgi:alpha-2-macroglobulin